MKITVEDMQLADIEEGYATRDDWRLILRRWLAECSEPDRFNRLLDIHSRCLHDGEHPVEASLEDEQRVRTSGTFPRYFS